MRILATAAFLSLSILYVNAQHILTREIAFDNAIVALDVFKYQESNVILLQDHNTDISLSMVTLNNTFQEQTREELLPANSTGAAFTIIPNSSELHLFYTELKGAGTVIHHLTDTALYSEFTGERSYTVLDTALTLIGAVSTLSDNYVLLKEIDAQAYKLLHVTDTTSTIYPVELPDELPIDVLDFEWNSASSNANPHFLLTGNIDTNGFVMEINDSANFEWRNIIAGNRTTQFSDLAIIDGEYYLAGSSNNYSNTTFDALLMEVDEFGNRLDSDEYNVGADENYSAVMGINDTSIILSGYSSADLPFVRILNMQFGTQHSWTNLKNTISGGTFTKMYNDTTTDVILLAGTNDIGALLIGLVGDEIPLNVSGSQYLESLTVYPNPASSYFMIKTDELNLPKTVQLYSITGALMYEQVSTYEEYFEVSDLPKGTYLLRVISNQKVGTEMLLLD